MVQRMIIATALCACLVTGTASASTVYRRDTVGDASPPTDIVSSSRIVWREDGVKWLRFSMRLAAGNTSVYGGRIRLDVDADGRGDARLTFSHWDNGSDPDSCGIRIDGRWRSGKAASNYPELNRFRCTIRRGWLPRHGPVGWAFLLSGSSNTPTDRAPDSGWFI